MDKKKSLIALNEISEDLNKMKPFQLDNYLFKIKSVISEIFGNDSEEFKWVYRKGFSDSIYGTEAELDKLLENQLNTYKQFIERAKETLQIKKV